MKNIITTILLIISCPSFAMSLIPTPPDTERFAPFFDDEHNPVKVDFPRSKKMDITPPPPELGAFDNSVLKLCGDLGTKVKPSEFKKLLYRAKSNHVIERIKREIGCRPFGSCNRQDIIDTLTRIWFKRNGFTHIFCGVPKADRMAGLHYIGRYLEMQQKSWGGPLPVQQGIEEIIPGAVYSLGIEHKWKGKTVNTKIKSYAYSLNAADLLFHTTRAFIQMEAKSPKNRSRCLYTVTTKQGLPSFKALLVIQNKSIITFYPDATPGKIKQCD